MRATFRLLPLAALWLSCQCATPGQNHAPEVQILSPRDGDVLQGNGPFFLQGAAVDADETLPPTAVMWSSDRSGALGFGASISASLPSGTHRLRLTATDAKGASGSAEISVTVVGANTVNTPPSAFIDAPTTSAYFDQGEVITLQGHATDAEDGTLSGAALVWTSSLDGNLGNGTQLVFSNASLGHHRVVLTATDSRGESAVASVEFDVVLPGTNHPPQVTIQSPAANATLTLGMAVALTGTATDAEDGALTGASLTWASSRDGALGTGSPLSVTLSQGVHVLTLSATDSASATTSASITVSVNQAGNQPPAVTITSPANNTTVFAGSTVNFAGTGSDPEDGALTGASLTWSSSRDGALGTGTTVSLTTLTAGAHVITLTGTDSGGNAGIATVSLTVLPMNAAPTVSLTAPADNTQVTAGTSLVFTATATDPEDGALTGNAVRWSSNLDGQLGSGVSLTTASLSAGAHLITVTATDSGGRAASASIHVTVTPGANNIPPIARLTGPMQAQATQSLTFFGDTSSDSDGTITDWRFSFSDGSPDVTGTSSAMHTFATAGTYTVTLTVTDDDNATNTATLTVTIAPFVRMPVPVFTGGASSSCGLAARGTTLHVAWYSPQHPTVMYGTYDNGVLTPEVVDSLGFNTGGDIASSVQLAVSATGVPFIAYQRGGQVWLATRNGATWVRERVDAAGTPLSGSDISPIALDSTGRVAIAYETYSTSSRVALAIRATNGTWTRTVPLPTGLGSLLYLSLMGDIAFTPSGKVLMPVRDSTNSNQDYLFGWNGTTADAVAIAAPGLNEASSLAVLSDSRAFLLSGGGLFDVTLAASLPSSTMVISYYETSNTSQHAVAIGPASDPRLIINHGSGLESVWPSSTPGYWNWLGLGTTDSGRIDAAVDGNGDTRACFFRSGKLMLY